MMRTNRYKWYFATSRFIQYGHFDIVPERGPSFYIHHVHVLYEAIITYEIVGDIIVHIFNQRIIADLTIMQSCIPDTAMFLHPSRKSKFLFKKTQCHTP